MYFNDPVHYLYFDAPPHQLYDFLRCIVKWMHRCIYVYQRTVEKGNKVRGAPCKFTGHTIGGASREPRTHHTVFFFFFFTLKISLNFKF
jgi:hypothetical protein